MLRNGSQRLWHHGPRRCVSKLMQQSRCSSGAPNVMAIRREDQSVWERRAPLSPAHVRKLVMGGVKVIVQPSNRRAYPMQAYADAGAEINESLSEASLITGVKQVPIDLLEADKTYAFFSHTIKAQEANMPLLDSILEKNITLVDYEKMVDDQGRRTVAFGQYAGVSGMISILHGLGLRLLALGHHTPFLNVGPPHNYHNTSMAKQAIREAGYEISLGLIPKSIGPLVFVFTGSGNVSQGAQEIFQELPHEYIEPSELPNVSRQGSNNKIYACVVSRKHHLQRRVGGGFCPEEYEEQPENYVSTFSNDVAPYASCIVNGIYWPPKAPRLISNQDALDLLRPLQQPHLPSSTGCPQLPHRLLAICDISADPGGSIEFMTECTTIDAPFMLYDAANDVNTESFVGDGVLICSIDNMPTQIPREATDFFGSLLLPYIKEMLKVDAGKHLEEQEFSRVVKDAIITSKGKLTPNFQYIAELRKQNMKPADRKKVTDFFRTSHA